MTNAKPFTTFTNHFKVFLQLLSLIIISSACSQGEKEKSFEVMTKDGFVTQSFSSDKGFFKHGAFLVSDKTLVDYNHSGSLGKLHYIKGFFKNGKKSGDWEVWFQFNDTTYLQRVLSYQDGKLSGKTFTYYPSGQKKSEDQYLKGKRIHKAFSWTASGTKVKEINYNQLKNGKSSLKTRHEWYDNGKIMSEKNIINDISHEKHWHIDGTPDFFQSSVIHHNRRIKIKGKSWYRNGNIKKETSYNLAGDKNGPEIKYYKNGKKEVEKFFVHNKILTCNRWKKKSFKKEKCYDQSDSFDLEENILTEYYSKKKDKIRYINEYDSDGFKKTVKEYFYKDQLKTIKDYKRIANRSFISKSQSWNSNGNLTQLSQYSDSHKKHGEQKSFHQNGKIRYQYTAINGLIEGNYFEFYDDGSKKSQSLYKNGKAQGTKISYSKDGKKLKEEIYHENGRLQKFINWDKSGKLTSYQEFF